MQAVALRQRRIVDEEEMDESCMERRLREECLLDGAQVEELCLDFTLPGYPQYALKQGGESMSVGLHNLAQYVELVVKATVQEGVQEQVEWCRRGFSEVLPVDSLRLFSASELDELFCGKKELEWTVPDCCFSPPVCLPCSLPHFVSACAEGAPCRVHQV